MSINQYLKTLPPDEQVLLNSYRKIILATDKTITEALGKMMSVEPAFIYKQQGAFKYALARTKNYFTFHCMVMYGFPEMIKDLKPKLEKVTFQKGCVNFNSISDFPLKIFEACMQTWATIDYMSLVEKHINKKNKASKP